MSAENILLRIKLFQTYGLNGMVPCVTCGRAIWPTGDYEGAVEYARNEDGQPTAAALPDLPDCGDHPVAKAKKR